MLDQGIEARIFRDDVKERGWVFARKRADVVGDMEVQGIGSSRFEDDVFRVAAKGLQSRCKRNGNLGLVGTEKDLDPEWAVLEQAEILRLNILEIDQDEVCSQSVLHAIGSEPYGDESRMIRKAPKCRFRNGLLGLRRVQEVGAGGTVICAAVENNSMLR
jgi:hypothetical protein